MADISSSVQAPVLAGATPVYATLSAADYFVAIPNARYQIHYKNGATPTGLLKVTDPTTPVPSGSTAVAGFADLQVSAALGANTERVVYIENSSRFMDSNKRINLSNATPTTLTAAVIGPF